MLFAFPTFFIVSTCSADHESILKLFTLLTCTPSLRCRPAQRIHRKIPRFQDAHPGFFAPQSAHRSLPGTLWMSSCNWRSLRACCLFDTADAMSLAVVRIGNDMFQWRTWRECGGTASTRRVRVNWRVVVINAAGTLKMLAKNISRTAFSGVAQ